MRGTKFSKAGIIILIVLLAMDIGSRVLYSTSEAKSARKVQYKVVRLKGDLNSYESLLNSMAEQGWTLDQTHMLKMGKDVAVFKN